MRAMFDTNILVRTVISPYGSAAELARIVTNKHSLVVVATRLSNCAFSLRRRVQAEVMLRLQMSYFVSDFATTYLLGSMKNNIVDDIQKLFERNGGSLYGGEAVTQLEHALQAAMLAESEGASPALIAAALMHDIGHLLHDLPDDAPDAGIDDVHEELAHEWLSKHFGAEVTEPVRMHVEAKRYLCAAEPEYWDSLSDVSQQSLELQGGTFTAEQALAFEQRPFFGDGVRLRRWDDRAKIVGLETPSLEHFLTYVRMVERNVPSDFGKRNRAEAVL